MTKENSLDLSLNTKNYIWLSKIWPRSDGSDFLMVCWKCGTATLHLQTVTLTQTCIGAELMSSVSKQWRTILSMWPRGFIMLMTKSPTFIAWGQFNNTIGLTIHAPTFIKHYLLIHFYHITALLLFLAFLFYPPFLLLSLDWLHFRYLVCICVCGAPNIRNVFSELD